MANEKLLSEVHVGVSPLSWTNDVLAELGGDISLETCLKDAAEIGYEGVELGRKFPKDGQKLSSILSDYGLRLIGGWHSGFLTERSVEEEWKAVADHCRLLKDCGSQVLVYGECGLMTGASPWDEPLSKRPCLKQGELSTYADKLGEFAARLRIHPEFRVSRLGGGRSGTGPSQSSAETLYGESKSIRQKALNWLISVKK